MVCYITLILSFKYTHHSSPFSHPPETPPPHTPVDPLPQVILALLADDASAWPAHLLPPPSPIPQGGHVARAYQRPCISLSTLDPMELILCLGP